MVIAEAQNQPQKTAVSPKQAIRAVRRQELLAALPRVVERLGPGASMEELAGEVGITKPVLYKQFGSRAGLCEALGAVYLDDFHREVTNALQGVRDAREFVHTLLTRYFEFVEHHRSFLAFLVADADPYALARQSQASPVRRAFSSGLALVLEGALRAQGLNTSPAQSWALSLQLMIEGTAFTWLRDGEVTREEAVEHLYELIWNGVGGVFDHSEGER